MALDVPTAKGVELPLTEALTQRWAPAAANGLGDRDVWAVAWLAGDLVPHAKFPGKDPHARFAPRNHRPVARRLRWRPVRSRPLAI
jgi:hypothetical protein